MSTGRGRRNMNQRRVAGRSSGVPGPCAGGREPPRDLAGRWCGREARNLAPIREQHECGCAVDAVSVCRRRLARRVDAQAEELSGARVGDLVQARSVRAGGGEIHQDGSRGHQDGRDEGRSVHGLRRGGGVERASAARTDGPLSTCNNPIDRTASGAAIEGHGGPRSPKAWPLYLPAASGSRIRFVPRTMDIGKHRATRARQAGRGRRVGGGVTHQFRKIRARSPKRVTAMSKPNSATNPAR